MNTVDQDGVLACEAEAVEHFHGTRSLIASHRRYLLGGFGHVGVETETMSIG
jgi:hypothetical protein